LKHVFLLDENVLVDIGGGGQRGIAATTLVFLIAYHCHKFAVDAILKRRYSVKLDRLKAEASRANRPTAIPLIKQILFNREKQESRDDVPPLGDVERHLPTDDVPLVRLAYHTRAILVTSDRKLIERLRNSGIEARYQIRVMSVDQAIEKAEEEQR
jgi:rRNA-processing protein FCF1